MRCYSQLVSTQNNINKQIKNGKGLLMSLVGTEITEGREEMGMLLLWSVEKPSNRVICKLISIAMNFNYEIT
jgi:hypothetical protein